jgi:hypothetical protein
MGSIGRLAIAAVLAALPAATAGVPPQQPAPVAEDDIQVMGRRLQTVRIRYEQRGRRLRRCEVTRSSGKPAVDTLMCAFVRSCVANGFDTAPKAKACVNDRIDQLTGSDNLTPMIVGEAGAELMADPDEIVVVASRPRDLSGYWSFLEMSYYSSNHSRDPLPPRQWRMCIRDQQTAAALNRILAVRSSMSTPDVPAACRRWRIEAKGNDVTGKMECVMGDVRMTGTLTGYLTPDTVQITKSRQSIGRGLRAKGWEDVIGTRIGDFP